MRVIRIGSLAWRDSADFDVKSMALHQIGRKWLSAQGFRYLFASTDEFAFGRSPRQLIQVVGVHFQHNGGFLISNFGRPIKNCASDLFVMVGSIAKEEFINGNALVMKM